MTVLIDIQDSDIAAIEAMHDLLMDAHGYKSDYKTLLNARKVTSKMYEAIQKVKDKRNETSIN
jgi:hypothetical protein